MQDLHAVYLAGSEQQRNFGIDQLRIRYINHTPDCLRHQYQPGAYLFGVIGNPVKTAGVEESMNCRKSGKAVKELANSMGQRSRNVRSTILQVMVVLVATNYWTPSPVQAESFYNSYKECYAQGSRFSVPDKYGISENSTCAEEGYLACEVIEQHAQENWHDVQDNCNAIFEGWDGVKANFTVEITFKVDPTDGFYHNASYDDVYVFLVNQTCPGGQLFNPYKESCEIFCTTPGETWLFPTGVCGVEVAPTPDKDAGCGASPGEATIGNPCDPGSGNKYQAETDYRSGSNLSITRGYNSLVKKDFGFGVGWSSNLFKALTVNSNELYIWQNTGRGEIFTGGGGVWSGDADSKLTVTESSGFTISDKNGHTKLYDANGKILSETTASGQTTSYTYNGNGELTTVTNHHGHSLALTWSDGHVDTITTPQGGVYEYSYDTFDRLVGVDNPDGATRKYHYENEDFVYALTGITDQNGVRYSTFAYDSQGRAISTEHADVGSGAQEKFQIDYGQ